MGQGTTNISTGLQRRTNVQSLDRILMVNPENGKPMYVEQSRLQMAIRTAFSEIFRSLSDSYSKVEVDGLVSAGIEIIQPGSINDGVKGIKFPSQSGIYNDYGNISVDITEGLNIIFSDGAGGFTKSVIPINLEGYVMNNDYTGLKISLFNDQIINRLYTIRENIEANPDLIFQTANPEGLHLGFSGTDKGVWNAPENMPAGEYTQFARIRFTNKGEMQSIRSYFTNQPSITILASEISTGEDLLILTNKTISNVSSGSLFAQIRTVYPAPDSIPANFTVLNWELYEGTWSLEEILQSKTPQSTDGKVARAKMADIADVSEMSKITEKIGSRYVDVVNPYANKISNEWVNNVVQNWDSSIGATSVINYVENGKLIVGGEEPGDGRLWFGVDFLPTGYANQSRSYVIALKGRIIASNVRDFIISNSITPIQIIAQDIQENVYTEFEGIFEFNFPEAYSGSARYTWAGQLRYDNNVITSYQAEFDVFAIFEKIEGFSKDDYIESALEGKETLKPSFIPDMFPTKSWVEDMIPESSGVLSNFKYQPETDITMLIGYGQSLAQGTGASSSDSNLSNSITFSTGISVSSASPTSATFVNLSATSSFTAISASLVSLITLLQLENGIDLEKYGNKYLVATGGLSGSGILGISKGSVYYTRMIEAVQKGKELANAEGKSFSVGVICWNQGESGSGTTEKLPYYNNLNQVFTDFSTDIQAITGQVQPVKFVTYQTSPAKGLWYPSGQPTEQPGDIFLNTVMGVQSAQIQLAKDRADTYFCGSMYQFTHGDFYHPIDMAVVGMQQGVAIKRILVDNIEFPTFSYKSFEVINYSGSFFVRVTFDPPVRPIRFDVSGSSWFNPNGLQPNYGFKVLKSGIDIISGLPTIVRGDTVVIPVSEDPVGSNVEYAVDGHFGGGNLCDSQDLRITNKNQDYIVSNFAAAFDDINL